MGQKSENTAFSLLQTTYFDLNAVVMCDMKLFQNYFSLHRRPSETILFNYFTDPLLQLVNIFRHVHCRLNDFEILLELIRRLK